MILAIDYDGVIMDPLNRKPGFKMGEPVEGAIAAMEYLKRRGHTLIIHTVRGDRPQHVADWLNHFKIPYDSIAPKVFADWYVDDHCVSFGDTGWLGTLRALGQ